MLLCVVAHQTYYTGPEAEYKPTSSLGSVLLGVWGKCKPHKVHKYRAHNVGIVLLEVKERPHKVFVFTFVSVLLGVWGNKFLPWKRFMRGLGEL